jgi:hypothetical protein
MPASGNQRDLSFAFQAPYPIQKLQVDVQQPARATGFSLTPQADSSGPASDGFTYYHLTRSTLAAGQSLAINMRYSKTDRDTSVAPAPTAAAPAIQPGSVTVTTSGAASGTSLTAVLPWLLVGVGVLIALSVGGYYLLVLRPRPEPSPAMPAGRGKAAPAKNPAAGARSPAPQSSRPATGGAAAAFCPQCGRAYGVDDQFCAKCGAARRR